MSNIIFYFTGTGNGRLIAQAIAEELGDSRIINITEYAGEKISKTERIGFVFPVYFGGLPGYVHKFLKRLTVTGEPYLFSVAHCGGSTGVIHKQVAKYLRAEGKTLHAGFSLVMPDNYIPIYKVADEKVQKEQLSKARERITEICEAIRQKKTNTYENLGNAVFNGISSVINSYFVRSLPKRDRNFNVADSCIGCEKCAKACGVHNITMKENRPSWNGHCELCLACIHVCPKESINYKKSTLDKGRYQAPNNW